MHAPELYFSRCITLAEKAGNATFTNPKVGAVLVHKGQIIGEGYHKGFGQPHAEIEALASVSEANKWLIPLSELYVTLEPCNHFGKTPPCTQAILSSGIKKVFVGMPDPDSRMQGKSIHMLREHGVEVMLASDPTPFEKLNRPFIVNLTKKRAFVTLKWAEDITGKIGGKESQIKITGFNADTLVHDLRSRHTGILVGYNTLIQDKPLLTVRHVPGNNPRPIFRMKGITQTTDFSEIQSQNLDLTFSSYKDPIFVPESLPLDQLMTFLLEKYNLSSVFVEGGRKTLQAFLNAGIWDQVYVFKSSQRTKGTIFAPEWPDVTPVISKISENDTLYHFENFHA
jgi:diaminohydroxyphosphoribosylaminopyrimidine deaminase/5-amino-6-(5-phosphoribosylamino)uracil reductase